LSKQQLLRAQVDFINLQKKLNHLLAIRRNKKRLMSQLHKLVSNSFYVADKLDNNLPDPNLPTKIRNQISKKKEKKAKVVKHTEQPKMEFDVDHLDKELLEIQRKLKELNS